MNRLRSIFRFAGSARFLHGMLRLLYALFAAVHLWPILVVGWRLVSQGLTLGGVGSFAAMVAVTVGFVLKALDAPALRFKQPLLGLLVILIIAGLAHHEVLPRDEIKPLLADPGSLVLAAGAAMMSRRVRAGVRLFFGSFDRAGVLVPAPRWQGLVFAEVTSRQRDGCGAWSCLRGPPMAG